MSGRILVTGAVGQVGAEIVPLLRLRHGADQVIATGHRTPPTETMRRGGPFLSVDTLDKRAIGDIINENRIGVIYHLATLLSGSGELDPNRAWDVNVNGLKTVLDLAIEHRVDKVFWPSSIAVFGPTTPREQTPQNTLREPTTMYGVTKLVGESLCQYYFLKHGLDVRSIRYPGLVTHKTFSGGGTTDYSVEMFFEAKRVGAYKCFVRADTRLPLMHMADAVRGTMELMEASADSLSIRTSYNLAALSFTAGELADEISSRVPGFSCTFEPDFRQAIADSWPMTIDDSVARRDWGWAPQIDLPALTDAMLKGVGLSQ